MYMHTCVCIYLLCLRSFPEFCDLRGRSQSLSSHGIWLQVLKEGPSSAPHPR